MSTLAPHLKPGIRKRRKSSVAYLTLVILSLVYFVRPEDFIHVRYLAKIAGGAAVLALIIVVLSSREKLRLPLENKLLIALFAWLCVSIPFAIWRGGAFNTVFYRFSKGVIVAILISLMVKEVWQLKRLIWIQAATIALVTIASLMAHHTPNGRLIGISHGMLENPNDLAINIALNWPLCLSFFFLSRGIFKRLLWGSALVAMLLAVQLTYSRSGFLALIAACCLALWKFGIRGRRMSLVLAAGLLGIALLVAAPGRYFGRIASVVTPAQNDPAGEASWESRKQLLIRSAETALHNPLLGIGAGNFEVSNGLWRVAHNTYTEIAAEGGFPAFILFILVILKTFVNLRNVRKSQLYGEDQDVRILTDGLWVSVAAFMVGAFFASYEYDMYPYYLVAYTTALHQIASVNAGDRREKRAVGLEETNRRGDRAVPLGYALSKSETAAVHSHSGDREGWRNKWYPQTLRRGV